MQKSPHNKFNSFWHMIVLPGLGIYYELKIISPETPMYKVTSSN